MRHPVSLAGIGLLWLLVGTMTAGSATSSTIAGASSPANAACELDDVPILRFEEPKTIEQDADWRPAANSLATLTFGGRSVVRGRDAACIELYKVGAIRMKNGAVFQVRNGALRRLTTKNPFYNRPPQTEVVFRGRQPVSIAEPGGRFQVGLWHLPVGSAFAYFDLDDPAYAKPTLLGTYRARLRGVTFFPSPDAPLGSVNVIQEIAPDHIVIMSGTLQWAPRR